MELFICYMYRSEANNSEPTKIKKIFLVETEEKGHHNVVETNDPAGENGINSVYLWDSSIQDLSFLVETEKKGHPYQHDEETSDPTGEN